MKKLAIVVIASAMAGPAYAVCYTLYSADGRMLSSSPTPPYSMAWPTEDPAAKTSRARGEHLIIGQGGCHIVPVEQPKPKTEPVPQAVRAAPAAPVSREQTLEQKVRWFDGGNLHSATVGQWREATYQNKLATAADWLAATKWKGHINTPDDIARVKIAADKIVHGLDLIASKTRNPDEKINIMAATIIQLANDVGP